VTVRLRPSPDERYFVQIRRRKLLRRLIASESQVLSCLDSHVSSRILKSSGERKSWPKLKTIVQETGRCLRTVEKSIRRLESKGFIERNGKVGHSTRWRLTIPGNSEKQLDLFDEKNPLRGQEVAGLNTATLADPIQQKVPNAYIWKEEIEEEVDKHVEGDDVDFERGDEEEDEEIRAGRILESVRPKLTPNQIAIALRYRPDPDRLEALIRKLKRDPKVRNLASYLYNSIIHGMDNAPPAPLRRAMPVAATDEEIIQRRRQREIIESLRRRGILGEAVDQAIAHAEQNERLGKFIGDIWRRDDRNNPTLAPLREAVCAIAAELIHRKQGEFSHA